MSKLIPSGQVVDLEHRSMPCFDIDFMMFDRRGESLVHSSVEYGLVETLLTVKKWTGACGPSGPSHWKGHSRLRDMLLRTVHECLGCRNPSYLNGFV